jgi:mycothiol synthase
MTAPAPADGAPTRPQLHMGRQVDRAPAELPAPQLPDGFSIIEVDASQASALGAVLAGNGELGEWDEERARSLFDEGGDASVELCLVVVSATGQPVATAQLDVHHRGRYAGLAEVGWVAVVPGMRGRRLGSAVTQAVVDEAGRLGHPEVFLRTDEWRLPAVVSYLRLGFRPWFVEPMAAERWQRVVGELNGPAKAIGEAGLEGPWAPEGLPPGTLLYGEGCSFREIGAGGPAPQN